MVLIESIRVQREDPIIKSVSGVSSALNPISLKLDRFDNKAELSDPFRIFVLILSPPSSPVNYPQY